MRPNVWIRFLGATDSKTFSYPVMRIISQLYRLMYSEVVRGKSTAVEEMVAMMNVLREHVYAAGLLLVLRIYLGWMWLTSGWHKLTGEFDSTGFLNNAINKPVLDRATNELIYPNYTAFLNHFALPNAKLINFIIFGRNAGRSRSDSWRLNDGRRRLWIIDELHVSFRRNGKHKPVDDPARRNRAGRGRQCRQIRRDYYLLPLLRKWFHLNYRNGGHNPIAKSRMKVPAHK